MVRYHFHDLIAAADGERISRDKERPGWLLEKGRALSVPGALFVPIPPPQRWCRAQMAS